jgi:hypothetical protein
MLYGEKLILYSEMHTRQINALYGQNVELLDVKLVGT